VAWPFKHWQASRYSDGTYGVWYGSDSLETRVSESVYHWYTTLLTDAGFTTEEVSIEREVYLVTCTAALLDLRAVSQTYSALLQATDYTFCQSVGARVQREGHPGLLTQSVRRPQGENMVIFKPQVLSNPRLSCQLTYRLKGTQIAVEKGPSVAWLNLAVPSWSS
jgi:RES domain